MKKLIVGIAVAATINGCNPVAMANIMNIEEDKCVDVGNDTYMCSKPVLNAFKWCKIRETEYTKTAASKLDNLPFKEGLELMRSLVPVIDNMLKEQYKMAVKMDDVLMEVNDMLDEKTLKYSVHFNITTYAVVWHIYGKGKVSLIVIPHEEDMELISIGIMENLIK